MNVPLSDIEWTSAMASDPNTRTGRYKGVYLRGILPTAAPWFHSSEFPDFLQKAYECKLIPKTLPSAYRLEGFDRVYEQQAPLIATDPYLYCVEMLRDASLFYLDMMDRLCTWGLSTFDTHFHNTIYQYGGKFLWCDLGSFIRPEDSPGQDSLVSDFPRTMLFPLQIRTTSKHSVPLFKVCMQNAYNISRNSPFSLRRYVIGNKRSFHRTIKFFLKGKQYLGGERRYVIDELKKIVRSMTFPVHPSEYAHQNPPSLAEDRAPLSGLKALVAQILKELNPATLLDIGSGNGFFSRLAAANGAHVLAVDTDEQAVNEHYVFLRDNGIHLPIALQCGFFPAHNTAFDLVLSVARPLCRPGGKRFPLSLRAEKLAQYSSHALVVACEPSAKAGRQPTGEPDDVDAFMKYLRMFFTDVDLLRVTGEPEALLFCRGRRQPSVAEREQAWYAHLFEA